MTAATALPWVAVGLLVLCALVVLRGVLKSLAKWLLKGGLSLFLLQLFAPIGTLFGLSLGVNLTNAAILAFLGAPGFGLLVLTQWMLT